MIWLFKVDEVFWNDIPKINEYYTFDTSDIEFDITQYDLSLYFATSDYYLHNDSNIEEIYKLWYVTTKNPMRILVSKEDEIYNIIREFHTSNTNSIPIITFSDN